MKRAGVVGSPISHSISPVFQQAALDALDIGALYSPYDVPPAELSAFVERLREPGWLGVNVTIPHKQAVLPLLDSVSPAARTLGAVNTIVVRESGLQGENTDVDGFLRSLRESGFAPAGSAAAVLGSGGAARAVVAALCSAGAQSVTVFARRLDRAETLAAQLSEHCGVRVTAHLWTSGELAEAVQASQLVVNTTPIGMRGGPAPNRSPLPTGLLRTDHTVYDLVYNPGETPLLAAAARSGARAVGGLDMLVYQGAEAFELWTGAAAPIEIMKAAAREALRG